MKFFKRRLKRFKKQFQKTQKMAKMTENDLKRLKMSQKYPEIVKN